MNVDEELKRLYGLPLAEFTSERNTLARELRKAGEPDAAEQVKALAKPSISAWAVNQLAREERMQVRALLTAGERLRGAQEKLLRGGSSTDLQEAFSRQREVVAALVESAGEILRSAGHAVTDATLERIRGTLTSVAGDKESERLVREGRLTEDLEPSGFGPLVPATGTGRKAGSGGERTPGGRKDGPAAKKRSPAKDKARAKKIEAAKRQLAELRDQVRQRTELAHQAKADVRQAERAAEAAKTALAKEERELERLTARLEAAKTELEQASSS